MLKSTTEILELTTSTTAPIDVSVSYVDITTTTFAPSTSETKITTATTTAILVAPSASTQRQIKLITIINRDASASNTVLVKKDISATEYNLTNTVTLLAGESMQYVDGQGWIYYSVTGAVKGSQTAGGASNSVQFNDGGILGGDADLTWDKTANALTLGGADTGILMNGITNEPSAPAAGYGRLYAKDIAGRMMPKWVGPSGFDYPLQSGLGFNHIRSWRPGLTTTLTTFVSMVGVMPYTALGTLTTPGLATTNLLTQTQRTTMSTGATAGALAGIRGNTLTFTRGGGAGIGGFTVVHRFALSGLQAGMRVFVGILDSVGAPTNIDPVTTTTPGGVGLAINTNSGNWNLVNNITATARTSLGLGANFPVNNSTVYELTLFSAPNGSAINYRITNLSSAISVSGSLTTNIPASTTFMTPAIWATNNATAAAVTIDFISTYVETDF